MLFHDRQTRRAFTPLCHLHLLRFVYGQYLLAEKALRDFCSWLIARFRFDDGKCCVWKIVLVLHADFCFTRAILGCLRNACRWLRDFGGSTLQKHLQRLRLADSPVRLNVADKKKQRYMQGKRKQASVYQSL